MDELNVPGLIYLNRDAISDVSNLSGAGGQGTVDELGFQPLYDSFANKLFPWCSTLTTRARYFFFVYSILERALESPAVERHIRPDLDPASALRIANDLAGAFDQQVRRAETALAVALVAKYDGGLGEGIFGSIRCRDWRGDPRYEIRRRARLLQTPGRYPNAIYRGASRIVRMYFKDSSNRDLIAARIAGRPAFAADWSGQADATAQFVATITDFWESQHTPGSTVASAMGKLEKMGVFRAFTGFKMQANEARFLLAKLTEATPYLTDLDAIALRKLASDQLDLLAMRNAIKDQEFKALFLAAYHADLATREFRRVYADYAANRKAEEIQPFHVEEVEKSVHWLDSHPALPWSDPWSAVAPDIRHWVKRARGGMPRLVPSLLERAEAVVGSRRKIPPHRREATKQDIRAEIPVQESSFRLWNASRILADIAEALP